MVDARASRTCDGHGDRLGLSLQARLGTRLGHQVGVRLVRHGHRVRAPESRESDETARRNPSGKRGGRLSSCTRRAARARQKRRRRGPSRRASEARARGRVWTAYVSSRGPRLRLSSAREIVRQSLSRNPSWTAVVDDSLNRNLHHVLAKSEMTPRASAAPAAGFDPRVRAHHDSSLSVSLAGPSSARYTVLRARASPRARLDA